MKKLERISFGNLKLTMTALTENQQRQYIGGQNYSWNDASRMMNNGTWQGGYVDGMGYVGQQVTIFSGSGQYYGSASQYVNDSLKTSIWDSATGSLLGGIIPGIDQGGDYINNQISECVSQLFSNSGYSNGPIFVSVNPLSNSNTNLQYSVKIYSSTSGQLLAQSSGSWSGSWSGSGSGSGSSW